MILTNHSEKAPNTKIMKLIRLRFIFAGLIAFGFSVSPIFSQTNAKTVEFVTNPATVSGKVTVEGKVAANVSIGIVKVSASLNDKPQATAKTDAEGKFSLENLPAGSYFLRPEIPGFVFPNEKDTKSFGYQGKPIVLEAGENLENADLKLVRGAIITGRLTDSEGKPLISEQIRLETFNEKGEKTYARYDFYAGQGMTDDRGVYRFYGLKTGKYLVSFGLDVKKGGINETNGVTKKSYYSLIYYPSVQNEKDAKTVELNVGETAENIDLRTGRKSPAFTISGTLYDEETGKPFGKARTYAMAIPSEEGVDGYSSGDSIKEDGNFKLKGFLPGKYLLSIRFLNEAESEYFSPTTDVEITDKNLANIKIYAKKGLSISGVVKIENKSQTNIPVNLSSVGLVMFGDQFNLAKSFTSWRRTQIKADGAFRFSALQPGEIRIAPDTRTLGLEIAKIEKDGIPFEKINLVEGQSIKDLLVTIRYGTNRLQGEIRFEGEIPSDSEIRLIAKPTEQGRLDKSLTVADERGKFLLEGLTPEQYDVKVILAKKSEKWSDTNGKILAQMRVILVGGVEGQTIFNVNLNQ